jgi:hypothetical protein
MLTDRAANDLGEFRSSIPDWLLKAKRPWAKE